MCVRVHVVSSGAGTSVYAHAACAEQRGVQVLYRVLPETSAVTR